jgi:hypothetical protein
MQQREVVSCCFVVSSGNASALLQLGKQSFDLVAFSIQMLVVRPLHFAITAGRDDGPRALVLNGLSHLLAVITLVGDHVFRRESLQERHSLSHVVSLPGCQEKLDGIAESVAGRMDLRSESATRPPKLLISPFFRAPAA